MKYLSLLINHIYSSISIIVPYAFRTYLPSFYLHTHHTNLYFDLPFLLSLLAPPIPASTSVCGHSLYIHLISFFSLPNPLAFESCTSSDEDCSQDANFHSNPLSKYPQICFLGTLYKGKIALKIFCPWIERKNDLMSYLNCLSLSVCAFSF